MTFRFKSQIELELNIVNVKQMIARKWVSKWCLTKWHVNGVLEGGRRFSQNISLLSIKLNGKTRIFSYKSAKHLNYLVKFGIVQVIQQTKSCHFTTDSSSETITYFWNRLFTKYRLKCETSYYADCRPDNNVLFGEKIITSAISRNMHVRPLIHFPNIVYFKRWNLVQTNQTSFL